MSKLAINVIYSPEDEASFESLCSKMNPNVTIYGCKTIPVKFNCDEVAKEIPCMQKNVRLFELRYKEAINYNYMDSQFSFSYFRNKLKEVTKEEWILYLDADEVCNLTNDHINLFNDISQDVGGYFVTILSYAYDNDKNLKKTLSSNVRIFRNIKDVNFENSCHENIAENIVKSGRNIQEVILCIEHYGYLDGTKYNHKYLRNINLLAKDVCSGDFKQLTLSYLVRSLFVLLNSNKKLDAKIFENLQQLTADYNALESLELININVKKDIIVKRIKELCYLANTNIDFNIYHDLFKYLMYLNLELKFHLIGTDKYDTFN